MLVMGTVNGNGDDHDAIYLQSEHDNGDSRFGWALFAKYCSDTFKDWMVQR